MVKNHGIFMVFYHGRNHGVMDQEPWYFLYHILPYLWYTMVLFVRVGPLWYLPYIDFTMVNHGKFYHGIYHSKIPWFTMGFTMVEYHGRYHGRIHGKSHDAYQSYGRVFIVYHSVQ